MSDTDIALMAHLMRRAGFGASRDELEERVAKGYEATVEELIDPDRINVPKVDPEMLWRYFPELDFPGGPPTGRGAVIYYMITSKRALEEKDGPLSGTRYSPRVTPRWTTPARSCDQIRHVPQVRPGQLPGPAGGGGQRPGHDLLAGQ